MHKLRIACGPVLLAMHLSVELTNVIDSLALQYF